MSDILTAVIYGAIGGVIGGVAGSVLFWRVISSKRLTNKREEQ